MLNNFFAISCDTAENGKIAVDKVKENNYDAILMDMRMPVKDGLEATKEIRRFNTTIPIICMSANVYKEDKIAAEESGMNDFIEKPLERIDIENKLVKLVNREFKPQIIKTSLYAPEKKGHIIEETALLHLKKSFNDETAQRLFEKGIQSVKNYIQRVNINFKNENIKELVEDFHALKGVLFNLGLNCLAKEAGELQKLSEKGEFIDIIEPTESFIKKILLE